MHTAYTQKIVHFRPIYISETPCGLIKFCIEILMALKGVPKKASRSLGVVVVSLLFLESLCVSATLSGLSPEMIVALA